MTLNTDYILESPNFTPDPLQTNQIQISKVGSGQCVDRSPSDSKVKSALEPTILNQTEYSVYGLSKK